jgi:spermidine synthase
MEIIYEELDYQETPLGPISLIRRSELRLNNVIIYEVKLGEEFLMTSLFTESEIQLAKLALAAIRSNDQCLDIVVGGLGLGYTARAALEDSRVRSVNVIDIMQPVIDWHEQGLVPLGDELTAEPRCSFTHADFYIVASSQQNGFIAENPHQKVHAVLLDIDHSPTHLLNAGHGDFYTETCLTLLADKLLPGGVFGLWSNDQLDHQFMHLLDLVFDDTESHVVTFANPYIDGESSCTIYLASKK